MKALKDSWQSFTWLQRVLAFIDIILNPEATNWPFIYTTDMGKFIQKPPRHFVVKKERKDFLTYYWCIRWL